MVCQVQVQNGVRESISMWNCCWYQGRLSWLWGIKRGCIQFFTDKIICVEVNDLNEGEKIGSVNKYHKQFLHEVMRCYPYCIYNADAVMTEESEDGD